MRLSTRLTLAMVGLVVLTAAAVSVLIHRNIEQRALPRVLDRLDTRAQLLTLQLEAAVQQRACRRQRAGPGDRSAGARGTRRRVTSTPPPERQTVV